MSSAKDNGSGHFHAVRFYEDPEALCRIVADFLADGLATSRPAIVVATPEHRAGILERFHAMGLNITQLRREGRLLLRDARETLATFMVDGMPDTVLFKMALTRLIELASGGLRECPVSVYGEMVDVLWKDGQQMAAMRLELLWNQLAEDRDFSLLCGYAMGSFYKGSQMAEIHQHHTHLMSAEGVAAPVN
jgi:DcmR-like sensory protein